MILPFEEFSTIFSENGLKLNSEVYKKFELYSDLLVSWNEKINLTAITDCEGISIKHFLDSLLILNYLDIPENASLIDVGTGAGFPGIPLKIYREDIKLTLLDSLNKRINFLNDVAEKVGVEANCIHARAEDGGRMPELREKFDIATARAVASLPVLCEYCLPFVKVGGIFAALKGPSEDIDSAKSAINVLGGEIKGINNYFIPNGDSRMLILIKKISHTSTKYPRNSAQIAKKSL